MATFEVTAPDGTAFDVTAPDTASDADVLEYAKAQWAAQVGTGDKNLTPAERLAVLKAQRDDPNRNPDSTAELEREIARLEKLAAPTAPRAPAASQADVRKTEPALSPGQTQDERTARWNRAYDEFAAKSAQLPKGMDPDQWARMTEPERVEWLSGVQNPAKTETQAQQDELRAGGDLRYGDSVPYIAAKALAAMGGFAAGGPGGATALEAAVRFTALAFSLKKALDAGAIDQDRAAEIMAAEMAKGTGEDALFNFGVPLLGKIVSKIPGMKWLGSKVGDLVAQRARKVGRLAKQAETPAGKQAVEEIASRTDGEVPTPGQVTGDASVAENAARTVHPRVFERQQQAIEDAVSDMRNEAVNPAEQPSAKALGEQIAQVAEDTQKAVKTRLRPVFDEANNIGVAVDMRGVGQIAEDALKRNSMVPGGQLKPSEVAKLQAIAEQSKNPVDAESALDFLSARKADTRAITADGVPSTPFVRLMDQMIKRGEAAYQQAAAGAGRSDVVQRLTQARQQYGEMMDTVYDDAVKAALKKNPEDVGRLFWQAGNVSELEQLQKLLGIAQREKVMTPQGAIDLSKAMTRGFLQEAVPNLGAAAKWSETLDASPLKRRTWETLTAAPGGRELRGAMEVLEQAAKIASRGNTELLGQNAILFQRAARGGLGVSYVTGTIHPGFAVAGFSIDALTRLMATAYTQGNKGVLNAAMRALRANSAGTAAGAKALQEALPVIEDFAAKNGINPFVGEQQEQQ